MNNVQFITPCPAICEECAENPKGASEDVLLTYCPHTGYGGWLTIATGQWIVMGKFDAEEEFLRAMGERGIAAGLARRAPSSH